MKKTLFLTTLLVLMLFLVSCITQPDISNQDSRSDFEVIINPEDSFEENPETRSITRNPNEVENYFVNYIGKTTPVTINSTNTLTDEWQENIRVAANNVIIKEKDEKNMLL
jgi:PBP1b-binding outer membrane lipoprotein LpoB